MARNTNTSRNTSTRTFVGLQLDNDLLQKVDALAAQEDRSRAAQIRRLLFERLSAVNSPEPRTEQSATA